MWEAVVSLFGLDACFQQTGRAGRGGERAHCSLLHDGKDHAVQRFFLVNRYPVER
jgi:ATP-dependent DNA helicase RecQ